jgi:hypothetical protein
MSPLNEMNPLMRELCLYYGQLWRQNRPFESDWDDAKIAKTFLESVAQVGLARRVETELGEVVWQATPQIFSDIGGLHTFRPRYEEEKEPEDGRIQISKTKKLVRDLDRIAERLMYTSDEMLGAIEVLSALRQVAFHLLDAIGESPTGG